MKSKDYKINYYNYKHLKELNKMTKQIIKAKQILNKYIDLKTNGNNLDFENFRFDIYEKYGIDDSDWDKVFMWDKNPRNTLLTSIVQNLKVA